MSGTFWTVVVLGCGCAANPWGIMCAVLLLDARRGPVVVWAYVLAWIVSLGVVVAVLVGGLTVVTSSADGAGTAAAWLELALGTVLLALGIRRLVVRVPADADPDDQPRWLRAVEQITILQALLLGIYSATYPFAVAATAAILEAQPTTDQATALSVLFVAIGSASVVAVAAFGTLAHDRSDALLGRLRVWLVRHNRTVLTAILLAFGVVLTAHGLRGLLA
jgi:cytochrome b561